MLAIDGTNLVLGRAASQIAKKLLQGEQVHSVNAESMIIHGNPKQIIEKYTQRRRIQHKGTPEKSPSWPKIPNLLVRRIIRGMLPWKRSRGKDAYKKLFVYVGNPKKLEAKKLDNAEFKSANRHITILELCKNFGYA